MVGSEVDRDIGSDSAITALGPVFLPMSRPAAVLPRTDVAVVPVDAAAIDADRVAHALGRTIRLRTISESTTAPPAAGAFEALHDELRELFPRVHATLERERIADWSLLYTWRGSAPDLASIVLVAHQDVVPIDPGTEASWSRPPFSGEVADGAVWGRGALDDKGSLVATLAAVEDLLARGFTPRRTVVLAFGHDEEVGGEAGARAVAKELAARGVRAALVLDEGGAVSDVPLPGLGPVALIGVAEKGQVSLELSVEVPGGHSSMPPREGAVGILAQAVQALERKRPRARMVSATRATLNALAPEMPLLPRLAFSHVVGLERLLLRAFATRPSLDATVRTTTATTMIQAGAKPNVLPQRASAGVNFRILPGETVNDVVAHARDVIDDERVRVGIASGTSTREPSGTSPVEGSAFTLLRETIAARFPGVVVAPYLVLGGTDARHFTAISEHVYRFAPIHLDAEARTGLHGTDERVGVEDLAGAVGFYRELIQRAQGDL